MLDIISKINKDCWEVELKGELDVSNSEKLKEHLNNIYSEKHLNIKLNFEYLDYIDSTGLGVIIGILKKLKLDDNEIYIVKPKKNVEKILHITGLNKIFNMEG